MNLSWQYKRLQMLAQGKGELVLGSGNQSAQIMLIGEAQGDGLQPAAHAAGDRALHSLSEGGD